MSDILEAPARRLEFVCATCLRSAYALDTDPIPRCPRCGIRMTADSDEPMTRGPMHRGMVPAGSRRRVIGRSASR